MKNYEIYTLANNIAQYFDGTEKFPVRAGFYFVKNKQAIQAAAEELEGMRREICFRLGTMAEDGSQFDFSEENLPIAQKELNELFDCEQDIKLYPLTLDMLESLSLTSSQIEILSEMIREEEDNE